MIKIIIFISCESNGLSRIRNFLEVKFIMFNSFGSLQREKQSHFDVKYFFVDILQLSSSVILDNFFVVIKSMGKNI